MPLIRQFTTRLRLPSWPQCRIAAVALGLAALGGSGRLWAEVPAPVPAEPVASEVITTGGDYWNLSDAEKKKPQQVRMELTVYYYDLQWHVLWAESAGQGCFLPVSGQALPLQTGQRVRLEGTVVPLEGLTGERIKVTVLDENALPAPIPLAGRVADFTQLDVHWIEGEGHVFGQSDADATHELYQVLCENRMVNLRLQITGTDPIPQLVGGRIKFQGVYIATRDSAGNLQRIDCWTSRRSDIELLGWLADDDRFKLPRTPLDQLSNAGAPWVRIVGEVRAQESGKSLTVRDDAGQIVFATAQPEVLPENTAVEIIGRPVAGESGWTLRDALFRSTGRSTTTGASLHVPGRAPLRLRLAEHVLKLSPDEAEKRYPVTLRGAVTWTDEHADFFYLQDSSGGVRVRRPPGSGGGLAAGSSVYLTGVTVRGSFAPEVELIEASFLGTMGQPSVRSITLDQALSGAEEGRRVEMRGYVWRVAQEDGWTRLDLTTVTGGYTAYLPEDKSINNLRGALVRVRGVCNALINVNREITDIRLWVQGREAVEMDEPSPTDPFAVTAQTIFELRQITAAQMFTHRVRLTGQVLMHEAGRYLYLQDESGGLFVLTREAGQLHPGDQVEVVGLPGRAGNRLVLREAIWRTAKNGPVIAPQTLPSVGALLPEVDAHLVRIPAVLRQSVTEGTQAKLTLQAGDTIFDAILHNITGWVPPATGSRLDLTGVYVLEFDEYRRPHGFRLELRTPADVNVLELPDWWTAGRALKVAAGLGFCTTLGLLWVAQLRRRVRNQTNQIRRQMEKEARLQGELERSSRLESLGVLAGGIAHDFNNLLTTILGNLGLAAMDRHAMGVAGEYIAEAERGAKRAKDLTQQLLTFAKGGDPVRTSVLLPDVVKEAAGFASHGSKVRIDFDFPPDLPPGDVDAGQISRVVHNLVLNAVQAMPDGGVVRIGLQAVTLAAGEMDKLPAGEYLNLTVADTGKGIPVQNLPRLFEPYFSTKEKAGNSGLGLATVRSIVRKHNGHITVESRVGEGTVFRIWLPVAGQTKALVTTPKPKLQPKGPVRVLIMDDEDVIRTVAGRMLSQAGHESVAAADGAEAVRTYTAVRQTGNAFDLVIFDLTVPGGMGGKDALQELLKTDPGIRAIASSGYSNDPVMANPRSYGFCATLPKPYTIPDLMKAVEEARRE